MPAPVPGLVVRYSYLWRAEHRQGRDEGSKDRPCAVVLATTDDGGERRVVVLPITHTPPDDPNWAVELPPAVKRHLGLDDAPSWVVLTEANRFVWPGPDLRPARPGDPTSVVYGLLPNRLFERIRVGFVKALQARRSAAVNRSE